MRDMILNEASLETPAPALAAGGIAVSFPLSSSWDKNSIEIRFSELMETGEIEEASDTIDNLARQDHTAGILERDRTRALSEAKPASIWKDRARLFPSLLFSPDVEAQLGALNPGWFNTVVNRLADLDASARDWRQIGGPVPTWKTKVSPESDRVMNNDALREARRFRSLSGATALFEWHARFGNNGRIHFQMDPATTTMEVGYIGRHLPL